MLPADNSPLDVFRAYQMRPGQMLCFHGPSLEKHGESLRKLTASGLLSKERFAGGYSLTAAGFTAMQNAGEERVRHD
jgi:hypothetical protein